MPKTKTSKLSLKEEAQSYAYCVGLIAFFVAYLGAEAALNGRPHPYHWIVAFSAAALLGVTTYGAVIWRILRRKH